MPKPVDVGRRCLSDIESAADYYLTHGGDAVADEFLTAVEDALDYIGDNPQAGSLRWSYELGLPEVRHWPLDRFAYLIFYVDQQDHVRAWRLLHARRDIAMELQVQD
ncbi:type II toxin-antitoxin system RelE/ParE family toxin [Candidatus Poriferisodalis sp.]|uniref:type II toxin-antitoxin system RelE/ParE family toxin n=1 Tax=Candidatus Poriferisodalis sp. TaxID=3101277 RepID=UPI003B5AC838